MSQQVFSWHHSVAGLTIDPDTPNSEHKKLKSQEITITEELPTEIIDQLSALADLHPNLSKLTVSKRKNGWGVYAKHRGISRPLKGPRREAEQLHGYINNWLQLAEEAATSVDVHASHTPTSSIHEHDEVATLVPVAPDPTYGASHLSALASTFLASHEDLIELSATEVDGFVYVTAVHEGTLYSIERCYQSWLLAKNDVISWIGSLAERNTTARAPLHSADAQHRDYNLRNDEQRSYDDTVRRPKAIGRCAGPDCAGALKPAQKKVASIERQMVEILRKKCDDLEKDLLHSSKLQGKLQKRCDELQAKNGQLAAAMANELFSEPSTITNHEKGGRPANSFFDAVGVGYSDKELSGTVFNHVNTVMKTIRGLVGDDAVKALQLSDKLQQRARGQIHTEDIHERKYTQMCIGVFRSIKTFLNDLQQQYNTKAPNDVRRVMQTVVTAFMSHFDSTSHRYLAEKLQLDRSWLAAGKVRALSFYEEGLMDCIAESRESLHKNRIPGVWRRYCHDHWLASCRAGEKMRDKLRNPKDRSAKELYTIHFREHPIHEMHKDCVQQGVEKWPIYDPDDFLIFDDDDFEDIRVRSGFKVSQRVYRDRKPFQIRTTARDQCLCIWHLRFEYLAEAHYNHWKARREEGKVKCTCPQLSTGTALRRHCVCPRPADTLNDKIECINQVCRHCRDLKLLQICAGCQAAFKGKSISYQIYSKREFTRKKGTNAVDPDFTLHESRQTGNRETKPDFVLVESSHDEFMDYLLEYWPIYIVHRDISKHQDRDYEDQRSHFPRGAFINTQDYSENYHHEAKKEYQSA